MRARFVICAALLALPVWGVPFPETNSSYSNPLLPGWHSDPSCIYVGEDHEAFFCVTSTFLVYPGIPLYASKDLINWRRASNVFSRPSQVPWIANATGQNDGIFAVTLRYHDGTFYATTTYTNPFNLGLIFTTTDPYRDDAWSEPIQFKTDQIDPDLFWDDDGQVYITTQGIHQRKVDLSTGETGPTYSIWNGTGGDWPEGPHIYKKDGYYYLMIAEGGTEQDHSVTIARSKNVAGPYESYSRNPILTNRTTTEYFQTVGHADLFQAPSGDWWGVALSTRSGPEFKNYPMGRESVLYPVAWEEGEWPVLQPVRGCMEGWPLPKRNKGIRGSGNFVQEPDDVDFVPESSIPGHFVYWRFPNADDFTVSPPGHPHTLRLAASTGNLSADPPEINVTDPMTLVMRRQTDSLFTYNVDVSFEPEKEEQESGVTLFLTQAQHIDLGVVLLKSSSQNDKLSPHFRFQVTVDGDYNETVPATTVKPVPEHWQGRPIRLQVQATNTTHYTFSASSAKHPGEAEILGVVPGTVVSGRTGPFTGKFLSSHILTLHITHRLAYQASNIYNMFVDRRIRHPGRSLCNHERRGRQG